MEAEYLIIGMALMGLIWITIAFITEKLRKDIEIEKEYNKNFKIDAQKKEINRLIFDIDRIINPEGMYTSNEQEMTKLWWKEELRKRKAHNQMIANLARKNAELALKRDSE